jgi:hypothetical protein
MVAAIGAHALTAVQARKVPSRRLPQSRSSLRVRLHDHRVNQRKARRASAKCGKTAFRADQLKE